MVMIVQTTISLVYSVFCEKGRHFFLPVPLSPLPPVTKADQKRKEKRKNNDLNYFTFSSGTSGLCVDIHSLSLSRKKT